jgi:NEDD8-activating enzyme E1 regulatory subunit
MACQDDNQGAYYRCIEDDVPLLKQTATSIVSECSAGPSSIADDLVHEMCRFGAGELHCVAAVIGGIASQEAIKLITKQFVPLYGTLVYNAMASSTSCFQL